MHFLYSSLHVGNLCFYCRMLTFLEPAFLKSFMNAIGPGLGPYYLQRLPADDKSCR